MSFAAVPLLKDTATNLPREKHPVDHRTSCILSGECRPRLNRPSRSSRAGNGGVPTIPSEIAPVENKSRLSYAAAKSSMMFTRRARAFRTYFIQQLDSQFFTPFSNRTLPVETMNFFPTPAPSNRSPLPTSTDHNHSNHISPPTDDETTSSHTPSEGKAGSQTPLYHVWQLACHSAVEFWELTKHSAYTHAIDALIQSGKNYANPDNMFGNSPAEYSSTSIANNVSSLAPEKDPEPSLSAPDSSILTHDQTTDAAGRHSPELRGSCMAVVIGLVVGIVWF